MKIAHPGRHSATLLISIALLSGCSGNQSSLAPASEQARNISFLWWMFCGTLSCIYLVVLGFLLSVTIRKQAQEFPPPILSPDPVLETRKGTFIGGAVAVVVVILFLFLVSDFATGRTLRPPDDADAVKIKITGHQWWWEVQYEDPTPSQMVTTANEIHVPVGKTVLFELRSPDVIHSFWAPNFDGKKDLVPGHPTTLRFRPEREGSFFGQCAEFCGAQHAHMRFVVVSEKPGKFQSWLEAQRQSAPSPSTDAQKKGQALFQSSSCALCHTIAGTPARGTVGPDLTHVASRPKLAAGTLPNMPGHLAGWILDPQKIKPGAHMPQNSLNPEDLRNLLEYLESLK
jgi:cytochrome c oxidase subunit 2